MMVHLNTFAPYEYSHNFLSKERFYFTHVTIEDCFKTISITEALGAKSPSIEGLFKNSFE